MQELSDFRVLIVPGLNGSGEQHWQTQWEKVYPEFHRVEQARWDVPDLAVWSQRLGEILRESAKPALIAAHSFGCLTTVNLPAAAAKSIAGALLVAPADPAKFGVVSKVSNISLPYPSVMIASMNDPWMSLADASSWAELWGSEFINAGALGHINAESGLGQWQGGLSQLRRVAYAAQSARYSSPQDA